ncbi:hypothetical protein RHSIM_Rhsim04G0020800 [Rhododendron simsii]|uniref:RING-type E3 ubiquitin transferase n=1 Tax=Rhododendron simsii TaxID=118357 RepID=A0A834H363_RHOSS|nr:hypothetical protein RHSIM_Rhsim04G0020800 [Rhododendron simsii]
MVPESTPTAPSTTFPHVSPILVHYTGGDRILNNDNNISSEFSLESEKYFWFNPTQNISGTNTSGIYKIEAYLIFPSRRNTLEFAFYGFWSQYSGKLCMVGSGSWYSNKGNLINLDAVLKLNYPMNLTIFSGLITGKLESLASPNDPYYFEPVSLLEYGSSSNYQYSLVSGEFDSDYRGGIDIPKSQSLALNPGSMKHGQNEVFNLEYSNECSSSKNCTPLGKDDKDELPNEMTSLESARIGDCSIRLGLRIAFRSRYNSMFEVRGLRYEYTVTDKVRELCPFKKPVLKKGNRYPKWNSNDLALDMLGRDSMGNHSWSYAMPSFFDDQNYVLKPFDISTSMMDTTEVEGKSTYRGPLNISYTISPYQTYQNSSAVSGNIPLFHISAEGLYDEETGSLCMVGCRKLSTGESMDCEILLKFQFPPVNAKKGGQIRGIIESMREEADPLYFKQLEITARPYYRKEAERSVRRLDLEIVMVLISNTLACVFVGLQILYAKGNPQVLPFVSLAMLLFLTLVSLSTMKENHSKLMVSSTSVVYDTHALWRDLRSFGGLVLDGFLLPQILLNIFQISTKDALSRPFYIGTTCVRILPRAYDLYRTYHNVRTQFDGAYIFANPDEDFYSHRSDVVISFWCVVFAVVIHLQQRFGGLCMFPLVAAYDKVPVISSDQ